jgi:hypothetical protein
MTASLMLLASSSSTSTSASSSTSIEKSLLSLSPGAEEFIPSS